jgi:hypothetical protein
MHTESTIKPFAFGIVTFGVVSENFYADQEQAVNFLCREFIAERNSRIALQYILSFKLLLRYTLEEPGRASRLPLGRQIIDALKRRAAEVPLSPEITEQYRQIQAAHPGIL